MPYPPAEDPGPDDGKRRVEGIFSDIDRLLHARRIRQYSLRIDSVSKPGYPGCDKPIPTLRLLIWEDFGGSLSTIKDEIKSLLSSDSIPIEVVNPLKCFQPSIFAIHFNDPTVPVYESTRDAIVEEITATLGKQWQTLCLFRMGMTEQISSPSIVITVQPRTYSDWSRLDRKIRRILARSFPKGPSINVEFLPGICREISPQETKMPGISFHARMTEICLPEMGCSIRVVGKEGGGSLGGFVLLKLNGKTHKGVPYQPPLRPAACISKRNDQGAS